MPYSLKKRNEFLKLTFPTVGVDNTKGATFESPSSVYLALLRNNPEADMGTIKEITDDIIVKFETAPASSSIMQKCKWLDGSSNSWDIVEVISEKQYKFARTTGKTTEIPSKLIGTYKEEGSEEATTVEINDITEITFTLQVTFSSAHKYTSEYEGTEWTDNRDHKWKLKSVDTETTVTFEPVDEDATTETPISLKNTDLNLSIVNTAQTITLISSETKSGFKYPGAEWQRYHYSREILSRRGQDYPAYLSAVKDGMIYNERQIAFNRATKPYTVKGVAVVESLSGTDATFYAALSTPVKVETGNIFTFDPKTFKIQFSNVDVEIDAEGASV